MLNLAFLTTCFASTVEIPQRNLYVSSGMREQTRLVHDDAKGFRAIVDGEELPIKNYNVRGLPKGMSSEQLSTADLYFKLNITGEDSRLEVNPRLRGGGPRWDGFKTWLVGPHPGADVFFKQVLPKVVEGTVAVVAAAGSIAAGIKK